MKMKFYLELKMNNCVGCISNGKACIIQNHNLIRDCPCSECIVKVTCDYWENVCDKYQSFLSTIKSTIDDYGKERYFIKDG